VFELLTLALHDFDLIDFLFAFQLLFFDAPMGNKERLKTKFCEEVLNLSSQPVDKSNMQYLITNQKDLLQLTYQAFQSSYEQFLGNKTQSTFQEVLGHSVCASIILQNEKVFAFCFHREMECKNWQAPPPYMADTPELFRKTIERKMKILTIEWLTVAPEHLGKFTKVQPADLILGCALNFMKNSWCNASMGYSRQDTKTDQMTMRFGTRSFGTVERFGIPCSVVFVQDFKVKGTPI
jgi:hypothetical protein